MQIPKVDFERPYMDFACLIDQTPIDVDK
jgi:hypothetical protein